MRPLLLAGLGLAAATADLGAQALDGRVGHYYEGAGWTLYRLGLSTRLGGAFGLAYHGTYLTRQGDGEGAFAGVGADLTAFRGRANGPYLVAGLGGGVGSPNSLSFSSFWGSWSAGAGYQLFPLAGLAFTAEARWREVSLDKREGLELSAGLAVGVGGGGGKSRASTGGTPQPPAPVAPVSVAPRVLRDSVVAAATDAMGRPYEFGGTGADGEGFDCSGLIQYAYGKYGIALPRVSADQAREGEKIPRDIRALAPGDLLTFSNDGGRVTHVGMYLGDGRFVHSASRGVQVSVLSDADPYGRWWYARWVGARRIVSEEGKLLDD
jgi:cell wall-associated NlpC family hydrolase